MTNGSQLNGHVFNQFAGKFLFRHVTCKLHYPEAYRLVENNVKMGEVAMENRLKNQTDLRIFSQALQSVTV